MVLLEYVHITEILISNLETEEPFADPLEGHYLNCYCLFTCIEVLQGTRWQQLNYVSFTHIYNISTLQFYEG